MEYAKNLLEAAKLIRDNCRNYEPGNCEYCAFYLDECMLSGDPGTWELRDEPIKAIKVV